MPGAGTPTPPAFTLWDLPEQGASNVPVAPAEADVAAGEELHRKYLASISEHDPRSLYHGRPDLAAAARAKAEENMADLRTRHGIIPRPPEEVAAERAEAAFESQWDLPMGEQLQADIDGQLEAEDALLPEERQAHIAALVKDIGQPAYDKLVTEARASLNPGVTMPPAALSNKFVLVNLAAFGRFTAAYTRARAAFDATRRR